MSDKGPITDEELRYGVDVGRLLGCLAPKDCRKAEDNHLAVWNLPPSSEQCRKLDAAAAANRRLRERFSKALKSMYELRYLPFDNPDADWERVNPHRYPEIIKQVSYRLSGIPKTFKLEGCDRPVPVRVFRRDGQGVDIAKTNYKELLRDFTVKEVVILAVEELIKEEDKGGRGFPRRVYERMGSPKKPPFETVRKYVRELFPGQK